MEQERIDLKRSMKPMYVQLGVVAFLTILLLVFATQLFNGIDNVLPFDMGWLTRLARWAILILAAVSCFTVWSNARKETYYVTKDVIAVKKGLFGSKSKRIYNVDNVTGLNLDQSFFGNQMNYGHIEVDLSMMTKAETIRLSNIEDPENTLKQIQQFIKK